MYEPKGFVPLRVGSLRYPEAMEDQAEPRLPPVAVFSTQKYGGSRKVQSVYGLMSSTVPAWCLANDGDALDCTASLYNALKT